MLKYKLYVLILFVFTLVSISVVKANNSLELVGKTIYIDPGHGGFDPGANYKDIKESDINLEISKILKRELEKNGATVYLTRDKDINLSNTKRKDILNRIKQINESDTDLYLSIHLNADLSPLWYGAQVFYDDINKENKIIAEIIQEELRKKTNTKRKVKEISNILLNRKIQKPGVLVELGFLSNSLERKKLQDKEYQLLLSKTITKGIIVYFTQ